MNKKIVFFDIDGTLVDHNKDLPLSTEQAIEELQKQDVSIVIATGRAPYMFEDIRKKLDIDSYISFNGQHVVYEGNTIYENPLRKQDLQRLHKATLAYDYPMAFLSDSEMRTTTKDHPYIKKSILTSSYPKVDPNFYLEAPIFQALMYCIENEEEMLIEDHQEFYFQRWHKYSCDIIPNGGSKAVGVRKIIEAAGLDKMNSYAFGDGINDIEMLTEIGTGIAMGNAIPELKSIADYTTDRVEDEGIAKALEQYKLI